MVKCELCGREFKTMQGLRGHKTFVHGESKNPLILSVGSSATQQRLEQVVERVALLEQQLSSRAEGDKMPDNSEYLTVKDFEHQKMLAQLAADAEKREAKHQQALETINNQLKEALDPNHRKRCRGGDCVVNQVHSQIFNEGVAYAKANLTVDDIPPKLIGDWIREMRRREGK